MTGEVRTTCPYCGVGCGLLVRRSADGSEINLRGDPEHPANYGRLCTKGAALGETLDLEGRLLYPMVNRRRVAWDSAIDTVAGGFKHIIDRHGPDAVAFYVSGQLLTEDYYVANKLMKGFIGSANIDTNSRLCMSSAVAGHQRTFGEDVVPGCYEDLDLADLIVLTGSNIAWCHPVLFQRMEEMREKHPHMQIVAIDPRRTQTAARADLHLALRPGTDVVLFNGLAAWLIQNGCLDQDYINNHTTGFERLQAMLVQPLDIDAVANTCDIDRNDLITFYKLFADTARTVTLFSQGVNQSSSGTDKVNAIINCHLITGRIAQPGAGPFSITGQPNAMGGREVGGLASTLAAHMDFTPANTDRLRRFWNTPNVAVQPGLKALDLFEAVGDGRIKAIWIIATNPLVSMPDADRVRHALSRCELVVISDCMENTDTTHHADILLPAAAWGEKDGTVTNSERRISRQRAFLPLPGEAKPDWWILSRVAQRMGFTHAFNYQSPAEIFTEHARLSGFENDHSRRFNISGLAGLNNSDYDTLEPIQWPVPTLIRSGNMRVYTDKRFTTRDQRACIVHLDYTPPVHSPSGEYPFILNSGRVRDHWHTMTRTGKSPRLSAHCSEPYIAIHPADARALSVDAGTLVEIASEWGRLITRAVHEPGQRPGEIFMPIHWNDEFAANARVDSLVNPVADPLSGEPEFKHTPVRVRPWPVAWYGFLFTREHIRPGSDAGTDYWVRIRERDCWRMELAGRNSHNNRSLWARRLLGAVQPGNDRLEFTDPKAGNYRFARIDDDRLTACLFIAPAVTGLPERNWLAGLFTKPALTTADRRALLAGREPGGMDPGTTVCACHGVGRNTLLRAITIDGLKTIDMLGEKLRAGTNCGACLPELRHMIDNAAPSV